MRMMLSCLLALFGSASFLPAGQAPTKEEAKQALRKAVTFFRDKVATHGGYLWAYSGDLKLRQGENVATETMAWVQPPGTPAVGDAILDAYDATGDKLYLNAAQETAGALLKGQLRSGGWNYLIEFDPAKRSAYAYREGPVKANQKDQTTVDDDNTQAALRFLMRLDKTLAFKNKQVHEAAEFALGGMIQAQRPSGGWNQWWKGYPPQATEQEFPIKKASYPGEWSRTWPKEKMGRYYLNDHVMVTIINTLLQAHQTYKEEKYLAAARKGGDFLILAQMPEPQPAWAQQYDVNMHPVWDRKFEPPAVTGLESQSALQILMVLYRHTGDQKYLGPIPSALEYLKKSRLANGQLARFYELKTNRPLYFKRETYELTYSDDDLPTHYGFKVGSKLDAIAKEYQKLLKADPKALVAEANKPKKFGGGGGVPQAVRKIIDDLDSRGAWVERGTLKAFKVMPEAGVISCATFISNVKTLSRYVQGNK